MTDEQRKLLTEYLGECWHEWGYVRGSVKQEIFQCVKCGETCKGIVNCHQKQRTFDNPEDFFVLWNWVKKKDWWEDFLHAANECAMTNDIKEQGIAGKYYIINTKWFPEMILIFGKKKLGWK
jgi:hypothetical protein